MYRGWTQTDTKSGYNMYRGWTQTDYQKWLQHVQGMDTNRYQNKHYNINQKDEGT
jgi:hypothetical protein